MSGALYFVQIDKTLKDEEVPKGFRKDQDYPVFKTNIAEDEAGEPFIELVMADCNRKLRIVRSDVVAVQPPKRFDHRPNNHNNHIKPLARPATT
jgi:hypothetical protein